MMIILSFINTFLKTQGNIEIKNSVFFPHHFDKTKFIIHSEFEDCFTLQVMNINFRKKR